MPLLGRRAQVVASDLLGHGDSAKPRSGDCSLGAHTAGLRDLLAILGLERATVVGHSFGGGVGPAVRLPVSRTDRARRPGRQGGLGQEVNLVLRAATLPRASTALNVLTATTPRWLTAPAAASPELFPRSPEPTVTGCSASSPPSATAGPRGVRAERPRPWTCRVNACPAVRRRRASRARRPTPSARGQRRWCRPPGQSAGSTLPASRSWSSRGSLPSPPSGTVIRSRSMTHPRLTERGTRENGPTNMCDQFRSIALEAVRALLSDDHSAEAGEAAARGIIAGVIQTGGTGALVDLATELASKVAELVERDGVDRGLTAASRRPGHRFPDDGGARAGAGAGSQHWFTGAGLPGLVYRGWLLVLAWRLSWCEDLAQVEFFVDDPPCDVGEPQVVAAGVVA
jgi:pimeloyl-ACP methyl ester carboxylesterase